MKNRISILLTAAAVSGLMAGCPVLAEGTEQNTQVSYPVTVTDQLGREVVIEEKPETLVSGYYISTSLLIALDQEANLVGVENNAELRAIYQLAAPELTELPGVGTAKEFDLEGCAALEPDLVIVPAKLKDTIPAMEELGMTVLAVKPESQELLEETITLLGTATDTMDRAGELLSFCDEQEAAMEEAVKDTERPVVYLGGNSALLSTAGPAMYQSSQIVNAGGTNAAEELTDDYWAEISYEQLLSWDPEYIILAANAKYTTDDVLADENLAACTAVQKGQVYQMPGSIEAWDSPVPGCVLGSLWMASVLHPEEYPAEQWEQAVTEFYETFYGFTPEMAS